MLGYPDGLWRAVVELSGLLLAAEDLETSLSRVADLAVRCIPGCDAVGVTLFEHDKATTRAATGGLVYEVDHYQYDLGEGPCLSAVRSGQVQEVESMSESERWPEFGRHAAQRGINSSLSFPLMVRGRGLGALNLYSCATRAFTDVDREVAFGFSAQASVALANAQTYAASVRLADELRADVASRAVIDQATGILMAQQGLGENEALEALQSIAQHRNAQVGAAAADIVAQLVTHGGARRQA